VSARAGWAPDGYERVAGRGGAEGVALRSAAAAVGEALHAGTLYEYGARHPGRRALMGRAPAYAVPLPGGAARVVVRHSRHGGLLAPLTGDRFLPPTRAPRELATALRLARAGVPTPELVAYVVYPAGPLFRTADVATREVVGGRDLAALLGDRTAGDATRQAALDATAELLRALAAAGARHPDLNVKNVLIAPRADASAAAYVLDVDRVAFGAPGSGVAAANLRRLVRSLQKWRREHALPVSDDDILRLAVAGGARRGREVRRA